MLNHNNDADDVVLSSRYTTTYEPGIMVIDLVPALGDATNDQSALNLAAKALFGTLRYAINGARNYESTDLMNYLITVGGMYSMVHYLKRLLLMANSFSPVNRYTREKFVEALGYDYNKLMNNMANNIFKLNNLIKRLSLLPIPSGFSLFTR